MLVEITPQAYGVDIDLVYATPLNFTGRPIYRRAACHLHPDTAALLARASDLARRLGLRLKVFDAFRPAEAQWVLWRHLPDPNYIADPRRGSPHSMGAAVDLTLVDAERRTRARHGHRLRRHAAGLLARRHHRLGRGPAKPGAAARADDRGRLRLLPQRMVALSVVQAPWPLPCSRRTACWASASCNRTRPDIGSGLPLILPQVEHRRKRRMSSVGSSSARRPTRPQSRAIEARQAVGADHARSIPPRRANCPAGASGGRPPGAGRREARPRGVTARVPCGSPGRRTPY